jgi:hypothetical protein
VEPEWRTNRAKVVEAVFMAELNNRITGGISMLGNRNGLFLIIGALIVAVGVLSYNLYQDRKQPEGLQINVGPNGLKIQGK